MLINKIRLLLLQTKVRRTTFLNLEPEKWFKHIKSHQKEIKEAEEKTLNRWTSWDNNNSNNKILIVK